MPDQLVLKNICKSYGSVLVHDRVDLQLACGKVHALLGENAAGKTTLVNIMTGLVSRDSGDLYWQGEAVDIHSPADAIALGIGVVSQHFSLFESLRVLDNIVLGMSPRLSLRQAEQLVSDFCKTHGMVLDLQAPLASLAVGERQRVEIVRCLIQNPQLVIFDEPTSVLTPSEVTQLFAIIRQLVAAGRSVLLISHKLDEIRQVCDDMTILRAGRVVYSGAVDSLSSDAISHLIIGDDNLAVYEPRHSTAGAVRLQAAVRGAGDTAAQSYTQQLQLKAGNISGIAGIEGNGQDNLVAHLSGERRDSLSDIRYDGRDIRAYSVSGRQQLGIFSVPTMRLGHAVIGELTLWENTFLGIANKADYVRSGRIDRPKLRLLTQHIMEAFHVKAPSCDVCAATLSGGNLQKFILGRASVQNPQVLILSNPTWGVDVYATVFLRNQILQLREQGTAILLISKYIDELFGLSDEIAVISRGQLGEFMPTQSVGADQISLAMLQ